MKNKTVNESLKICIENYGCSANYNNGEIIAGILKKAGHEIVGKSGESKADIIILNTCTVKEPTEKKILKRIKKIPKNKKLIVAGCMPEVQADEIRKIRKDASLLGVGRIEKITELVEKLKQGKNKKYSEGQKSLYKNSFCPSDIASDSLVKYLSHLLYIGGNKETKLLLPRIRKNPVIEIVQISEGCNQNCSYCIVRLAKGELVSYPADKIVEEIKQSVKQGCKEIWITSQDNASYENSLPDLLKKITSVEGDFMVRIGMMNPVHIIPIKKELIKIYKNRKIFKFLHIPVQSGNDRVLKLMNRKYSVAEFKKIISDFRKEIPDITISTDIICGFPTETEKEFKDSLKLVKELRFDVVNVSRFGARPGTAAAKMKQIHGNETKKRSQEMTRLCNKIISENMKKWKGTKQKILVDEFGKKKGQFVGRTMNYLPVVVEGKFKLGDSLTVKITDSKEHYLVGVEK